MEQPPSMILLSHTVAISALYQISSSKGSRRHREHYLSLAGHRIMAPIARQRTPISHYTPHRFSLKAAVGGSSQITSQERSHVTCPHIKR